MRPGIHPNYHPIVFRDKSADFAFLTRSTMTSDQTIEWEDGNIYPRRRCRCLLRLAPLLDRQGPDSGHRRARGEVRAPLRQDPEGEERTPMKVRASIRSLAKQPGSKVVRRRGHTYVINKKNPRFKARQG